jgi:hypothetical protein
LVPPAGMVQHSRGMVRLVIMYSNEYILMQDITEAAAMGWPCMV